MKIRVYIGASTAQIVPSAVLAHSIHATARPRAMLDEIATRVIESKPPVPKDKRNRARTPFSFQRFMIPQACGYSGRAIYLDSDMLCFADIMELWSMDMGGAAVLTTDVSPDARNAVMLIDCERALWDVGAIVNRLDLGEVTYQGLMENLDGLGEVRRTIPDRWNRLDVLPEDTAILHFTDMRRQPWRFPGHPLDGVWMCHLYDAMKAGALGASEIARAEKAGHVRSGLLEEMTNLPASD